MIIIFLFICLYLNSFILRFSPVHITSFSHYFFHTWGIIIDESYIFIGCGIKQTDFHYIQILSTLIVHLLLILFFLLFSNNNIQEIASYILYKIASYTQWWYKAATLPKLLLLIIHLCFVPTTLSLLCLVQWYASHNFCSGMFYAARIAKFTHFFGTRKEVLRLATGFFWSQKLQINSTILNSHKI